MKPIRDYQIVQRNSKGFAYVEFSGTLKEIPEGGVTIAARIRREDDNLQVCGWQNCEIEGTTWRTVFAVPEGGLYRAEAVFFGGSADPMLGFPEWTPRVATVSNFGVGDVFVITGQSNMSGYGQDTAYDPPELGVHLYANDGNWKVAAHPMNSCVGSIYINSEGTGCTSPALSFARTLHRRLGVPIGLIQASRGGSNMNEWHPESGNACLYNEMLKKLDLCGDFAGFIWYQGCSEANAEKCNQYYELFKRMLELWREKLGDHPMVTVQLGRWADGNMNDPQSLKCWGIVREAQRQAAMRIHDVAVVPANDLYCTDGIHNGSGANVIIGERMANAWLKEFCGKPGLKAPTVRKCVRLSDTEALIMFDADLSIRAIGCKGLNFEDENGLVECVGATKEYTGVKLTAARPLGKNARFHAYWLSEMPSFFIRDINGMPMLSCYNVPVEE
ncbi:MAG: sialate O-acetylesterase [Firmicutes bacterium]|nr:sialate O-acetylesterase [Bacillota bacterium]